MRRIAPRLLTLGVTVLLCVGWVSVARAQSAPQWDPYLGVYILTSGAARPGDPVSVENHATIERTNAHGVVATSVMGGYSPSILTALANFSANPFSYVTTHVVNLAPDGTAGAIGSDVVGVRVAVNGTDENVTPIDGAGGRFKLSESGGFEFDPGTDFDDLAPGASVQTSVEYDVLGTNIGLASDNPDRTRVSRGMLIVTVSKDADGNLSWSPEGAEFQDFGSSDRPTVTGTVFPDLKAYVTGMLRFSFGGRPGTDVVVLNDGSVTTYGVTNPDPNAVVGAHGIYAHTEGVNGSNGRNAGLFRSSRQGSAGGQGGDVTITANGIITTYGEASVGVLAKSSGGNGGIGGEAWGWHGASSGGPGANGSLVTVTGSGTIRTYGNHSSGILAISQGGDGGAGGNGATFQAGASGATGGAGGAVVVDGSWNIKTGVLGSTTEGTEAHGIFAKSLGGVAGSGGRGGWTGTNAGGGGQGTWGGSVTVTSGGTIVTYGASAHGIYALSSGGFGGQGGDPRSIFREYGGTGGGAGSGGSVTVTNTSTGRIETHGVASHGIFAQSVGGGGGSGGSSSWAFALLGGGSGSGGHGGAVTITNGGTIVAHAAGSLGIYAQSIGGNGGDAGNAGYGFKAVGGEGSATSDGAVVNVTNTGTITTTSNAIYAQSVGGGGGRGGSSIGLFSLGGSGGGGGNGATVTVSSHGSLTTTEDNASAIFAQSLGGGGGSGGNSTAVSAIGTVSIGGSGALGGTGGDTKVGVNSTTGAIDPVTGVISTSGANASGIDALSVGGGGGKGGFAISIGLDFVVPAGVGAAVSLGGSGGGGNTAGATSVYFGDATSSITTTKSNSSGISAQSVGGGGGSGGYSVAASIGGFSNSVSLGGNGGTGGNGAAVTVGSGAHPLLGTITTGGWKSYGVFAQSLGGGGGNGGLSVAGSVSLFGANVSMGGNGAGGGTASSVTLYSHSKVTTTGADAHGLFAQSQGGGGGAGGLSAALGASFGSSVNISLGGNSDGGGDSGLVTLRNQGTISTSGTHADGIHAQSVGGGGGDGGFAAAAGASQLTVSFGIGGQGGGGGDSGAVDVINGGAITTTGAVSHGLYAQSAGGGGGSGGFSISGTISTTGALGFALGGKGGGGGDGSTVTVNNSGTITTGNLLGTGTGSHAIFAESVGGGGGTGGFGGTFGLQFPGYTPGGAALSIGVGGKGGDGGDGKAVTVTNTGELTTQAGSSHAIFAQSVGGGGGDAGTGLSLSVSAGQSQNVSIGIAIGGFGGGGGSGDVVDVSNSSTINTSGGGSRGIFAQSVGGGGGNGGAAVTLIGNVGFNSTQPSLTIGGSGGDGGDGKHVTVTNNGFITTTGSQAIGILAQSVGKGGGNGGLSISGALGGPPTRQFGLTIGGSGAGGGSGGQVDVFGGGATSGIRTEGNDSHGIEAQSLGGGGGNGAMAVGVSLGASNQADSSFAVNAAIGGSGGTGNIGGTVNVGTAARPLEGSITTLGSESIGILAQSIGGGGGTGGMAFAGSLTVMPLDRKSANLNASFSLGGLGGEGNNGGAVTVHHHGNIDTTGDGSYGIEAQSIGGGGGNGGAARSVSLQLGITRLNWACKKVGMCGSTGDSASTFALDGSIGGNGGKAGNASAVTVTHDGSITTRGGDAYAIFAQSIGGGGGAGGNGHVGMGFTGSEGVTLLFGESSFAKSLNFVLGGSGGASGNGNEVSITKTGSIVTYGAGSTGIFAQSIGGGGGAGGNGVLGGGLRLWSGGIGGGVGTTGNGGTVKVQAAGSILTLEEGAEGIFAQSLGGGGGKAGGVERGLAKVTGSTWSPGLGLAFGRGGGNGGNGGQVAVDSTAAITTWGSGSTAIFAQSVGGGGGIAGSLGLSLQNAIPGIFAGSTGGYGSGGEVRVTQTGNIFTFGDGADGIVAQSAGGRACSLVDTTNLCPTTLGFSEEYLGAGGKVTVTLNSGNIVAYGAWSDGIFAQSVGEKSAGDVTVNILDKNSVVFAGGEQGAAIRIYDGHSNTVNNYGTLANGLFSGPVLVGGSGNESVRNWGTVTGSVDLGAGINRFSNYSGASFYTGDTVNVGTGGVLDNAGTLSLGPQGTIQSVTLTGDFMQTGTPKWLVDVGGGLSDSLKVSGHAYIAQSVTTVDIFTQGLLTPGRYTLLSARDGVAGAQFRLGTLYGQIPLSYTLDFANSNTSEQLTVLPSTGPFYWTGAVGGTWASAFARGVSNWSRTGGTDYILGTPGAASDVFFSNAGLMALGANFAVNSLTFNGSSSLASDGSALTIGGAGGHGLTVNGSAAIGADVILGGDQSWLTNGRLIVNGSSVSGAGRNLTIDGSGTTQILAAIQTGSGSLTKSGTGTLVLTGANSYSGGTTLLDGTLVGNTTSLQGDIVDHAALVFDQADVGTFAGSISGSGWLLKDNVGTLTLTGHNTYTGGTWVRGGRLIGTAMSLPGSVLNEGILVFDEAGSSEYGGTFDGTGSVIKQGSGSLVLTGNSASFKGSTIVEAGQLFVNGLLGGSSLVVGNGALLGGSGLVTNTTIGSGAVLAPGNSVGTLSVLSVLGDLRLNPGATYRVETEAYGASDLTLVAGNVLVDGATLDVQPTGSKRYRPINFYSIFATGGAVTGAFSAVTTNAGYLNPSLQYSADGINLTLRRTDVDFRDMGTRGNQSSVALALNQLVATATGGLASVVNTVYDLPERDALNAMGSMTGVLYQHTARAMLDGVRMLSSASMRRLIDLGGERQRPLGDRSQASSVAGDTAPGAGVAQYGAWIGGLGGVVRYHGSDGDPAAKSPMHGFVAGFDTKIGDRFTLGGSGGQAWPDVTIDGWADRAIAKMFQFDVYARYAGGANRLDAVVGGGRLDNESSRIVTDGITMLPARSDYRGDALAFEVEYGHRLKPRGGFVLEPMLGIQIGQVRMDGVTEQDADVLGLVVPARTVRSERLLVGSTVGKTLGELFATTWMVHGRAAWVHDFHPIDGVPLRFTGDPFATTFTTAAPHDARNSGLGGLRLLGHAGGNFRIFAEIDGEAGGPSRAWSGSVGVTRAW